jgi:acetoin:2,6-dichlorophenolindophenol oxidoreductase subunit beta
MTTVLRSLNQALLHALRGDERVYLLGEDILDPYGGAFKVTRDLSTAYPQRVLTTPISEAGITGVAAGMALRGLRPIAEIMFGDFLTLAADQLVNYAAKFRWMYHDQVRLPLLVRTPMGGRRGYGPTHSQTLEKLFLGVPGLRVVAPCALAGTGGATENGAGGLLERLALESQDPTLFVENKLLYLLRVSDPTRLADFDLQVTHTAADGFSCPAYTLRIQGAPPPSLTVATYGYMAELARQAALRLAYEQEIFVELVVLTQLSPFDITPVTASLQGTGRLLAVEEGSLTLGWGAEIVARCAEALGVQMKAARRVAALDLPIPAAAALEEAVLPGVETIIESAQNMLTAR